jgi:hypothetical protein
MENPTQTPPLKQRHGCLTAWLTLMIILNSILSLVYLASAAGASSESRLPTFALLLLSAVGIANVACAIALFKWKKVGFYGFIGTSAVAFFINISIGLGIGPSLIGLVGIGLLYGVLQIGNEHAGWRQLD